MRVACHVALEDQRLRFVLAQVEHLRGDLYVLVVEYDDVFRGRPLQRGDFAPRHLDGFILAIRFGEVAHLDLEGRRRTGRQECGERNRKVMFHCCTGVFEICIYDRQK